MQNSSTQGSSLEGSDPPPKMWSQRTFTISSDIDVIRERFHSDTSQNNPTSRILSTASSSHPTRSYLQAKVGSTEMQPKSGSESSGQINGEDAGSITSINDNEELEHDKSSSNCWAWSAGTESSDFLANFVEETDQDLFLKCREHMDAINRCTHLQQAISDDMRTQAELDKMVYKSLKIKLQRLEKQVGVPKGNTGKEWVYQAFNDLRKCLKDEAHTYYVYSLALHNQTTTIQQSLDEHMALLERTRLADSSQTETNLSRSGNSSSSHVSMSFSEALCVYEKVRKPRLKLVSELDYLNTQLRSLAQQLRDVERMVSKVKKIEDGSRGNWGIQLKMEEGRSRIDFLLSRHDQLESELRRAAQELKGFHFDHRDKMTEVANVFSQHRLRCDATLKKSMSLLTAAYKRDPEILHTLDSNKDTWLSPQLQKHSDAFVDPETVDSEDSSGSPVVKVSKKDIHNTGNVCGMVKIISSAQDKNPLKTRKVCFGRNTDADEVAKDDHNLSNHSPTTEKRVPVIERHVAKERTESARRCVEQPEDEEESSDEQPNGEKHMSPSLEKRRYNASQSKKTNKTNETVHIRSDKDAKNLFNSPRKDKDGLKEIRLSTESQVENKSPESWDEGDESSEGCDTIYQDTEKNAPFKKGKIDQNVSKVKLSSVDIIFPLYRDAVDSKGRQRQRSSDRTHSPLKSRSSASRNVSRTSANEIPDTRIHLSTKPRSQNSHIRESRPSQGIFDALPARSASEKNTTDHTGNSSETSPSPDCEPDSKRKPPMSKSMNETKSRRLKGAHTSHRDVSNARQQTSHTSELLKISGHALQKHKPENHDEPPHSSAYDTCKRRVAFSDVETSETAKYSARSSQDSNAASGSFSDRGILKKSSDHSSMLNKRIWKDDKTPAVQARNDHDIYNRREKPALTNDMKDAFIPETTRDESQSDSSAINDNKGGIDSLTASQQILEENHQNRIQASNSKARFEQEEDIKMNRLIKKYAPARLGHRLLSKNSNNSETTEVFHLPDEAVQMTRNETVKIAGRADILNFDCEAKANDVESGKKRIGCSRQIVKICAVRPMSSEPDNGEKRHEQLSVESLTDETSTADSELPANRQKTREDMEQAANLRRFEITAGLLVTPSRNALSAMEANPIPEVERLEEVKERDSGQNVSLCNLSAEDFSEMTCRWTAQRYDETGENLNNNLLMNSSLNTSFNGLSESTDTIHSYSPDLPHAEENEAKVKNKEHGLSRLRTSNVSSNCDTTDLYPSEMQTNIEGCDKDTHLNDCHPAPDPLLLFDTDRQAAPSTKGNCEDGSSNILNRFEADTNLLLLETSEEVVNDVAYVSVMGTKQNETAATGTVIRKPLKSCLKRRAHSQICMAEGNLQQTLRNTKQVYNTSKACPTDENINSKFSMQKVNNSNCGNVIHDFDNTGSLLSRSRSNHSDFQKRVHFQETIFYSSDNEITTTVVQVEHTTSVAGGRNVSCCLDSNNNNSNYVKSKISTLATFIIVSPRNRYI